MYQRAALCTILDNYPLTHLASSPSANCPSPTAIPQLSACSAEMWPLTRGFPKTKKPYFSHSESALCVTIVQPFLPPNPAPAHTQPHSLRAILGAIISPAAVNLSLARHKSTRYTAPLQNFNRVEKIICFTVNIKTFYLHWQLQLEKFQLYFNLATMIALWKPNLYVKV